MHVWISFLAEFVEAIAQVAS